MKSTKNSLLLILCVLILSSCAKYPAGISKKDTDVIAVVTPISVKVIMDGASVDAIEEVTDDKGPGRYKVLFRIDKVLKGEFAKTRMGGPSTMEQAKEAAKNKEFLRLLTLDFSDPDDEKEKELLSVAVFDPEMSFGIKSWESPHQKPIKLYLKRMIGDPDSFILVHSIATI